MSFSSAREISSDTYVAIFREVSSLVVTKGIYTLFLVMERLTRCSDNADPRPEQGTTVVPSKWVVSTALGR